MIDPAVRLTKMDSRSRIFGLVAVLGICTLGTWAQVRKPDKPAESGKPVTSPTLSPAHEMTSSDVEAFLDGIVPMQLQREDIAGAVIVIVKNGTIFFGKGYGYADVKTGKPVSPDSTLFRPGSISKTFTWTAVMQLVEQGKINLDTDINNYLDFSVPHTFGRPVTMRNLMTHTAGFEEVIKDLMVDRPDELPLLQPFVISHRPNQIYAPGTIPAYSNYGADLAGYIVQRVSGLPFEEYVQKNIFRPLGILHGTYVQPLPDSLKSMMSNGYELASEDPKAFELVPPAPAPDGSLSITGADMAPFMIAHLQNGQYGNTRILQEQTAKMMHAQQFSMDPAVNGMALGFYEENRNGLRIIGHGGDLNYFHSDMHLLLEKGVGFFVSYNSLGKGEMDVRSALWHQFLDRYFPIRSSEPETVASADFNSLAGNYLSSRRAQTTIMRSLWWMLAEASVTVNLEGTLRVDSMKDFSGQPKRWRPIGDMKFREVGGQELLVFKRDLEGHLEMFTEDPIEIFQRVSWTQKKTVLLNSLGFAAAVFALTLILWPIRALVRRHYDGKLFLTPPQRRLRLLVYLACAINLVALLAFAGSMAYGFSNLSFFSGRFDVWFRIVQLLFLLGVAGAIVAMYCSYQLWRTAMKGWWATARMLGVVLACAIFVWLTVSSRILQFSLNY